MPNNQTHNRQEDNTGWGVSYARPAKNVLIHATPPAPHQEGGVNFLVVNSCVLTDILLRRVLLPQAPGTLGDFVGRCLTQRYI